MNTTEQIEKEIKELYLEVDGLLKELMGEVDAVIFSTKYNKWYSRSLPAVRQLAPDRVEDFEKCFRGAEKEQSISTYFASALMNPDGRKSLQKRAAGLLSIQHGIIASLESRLSSVLTDIRSILQADLFDSELDAAKNLLSNGHVRAAGSLAGVVLEGHLKNLCIKYKVRLPKPNPALSDYYQELYKAKIIDNTQRTRLQYLGTIRNLCSHKKDSEPTEQEVSDLIAETHKTTKLLT